MIGLPNCIDFCTKLFLSLIDALKLLHCYSTSIWQSPSENSSKGSFFPFFQRISWLPCVNLCIQRP
ncbi:hypothetical protein V6Z11_D02G216200 [Gossypium hirsutum]